MDLKKLIESVEEKKPKKVPLGMPDADRTYRLLMDYCLKILGRKQYSVSELTKKMKIKLQRLRKYAKPTEEEDEGDDLRAQLEAEAIQKVLARLQEWAYLSDKKIIDTAIEESTTYSPGGKNKFVAKMLKKGISLSEAKTAWESKNIDECALALEVLKKSARKYAKFPLLDRKRKMAGLLARKGFSGDVVWSTLEKLTD